MNCLNCNKSNFVTIERHGVDMEYCLNCKGVWLDRGKLDSIIERISASGLQSTLNRVPPVSRLNDHAWGHQDHHDRSEHHQKDHEHEHHKNRSIWHRIFD